MLVRDEWFIPSWIGVQKMVYVLIGWGIFVAVVFAYDLLFDVVRAIEVKRRRVAREVLEKNAAAADEYEIAFLKGGDDLARMLAVQHLLRSGYYDKTKENLKPNGGKDPAPLSDFERAVLLLEVSAEEGEFKFSGDEAPVKRLIDGYAQKARDLNLFFERTRTGGRTVMLLVLIVMYILIWGALGERLQLVFGCLIVGAGGALLWRRKVNRPVFLALCRGPGDKAAPQAISNHVLTPNGRVYVSHFETVHYPVDEKLAQAWMVCPCSLLD